MSANGSSNGKAPAKRGRGRPTKLTLVVQAKIIDAVLHGAYREPAACSAGISKRTFQNWIARGEEHDGEKPPESERLYVDFLHAIEKAEGDFEVESCRLIAAGDKRWVPRITMLERKYQNRWGRRERMDVKHSGSVDLTSVLDAAREHAGDETPAS